MAGYGYLPANARDKVGDTLGGFGSSAAIDSTTWKRTGDSYTAILYGLPDRGWNTEGTINYQNRIQKFQLTFTPNEGATVSDPSSPNIDLKLMDTILLTDPSGTPTSGLDADIDGPYISFPEIPVHMPSVHYPGNGFNGSGPGGYRVVIDSEGLFLGNDGTFWVSDEYGPYIYHFSSSGRMLDVIRPPNAFLPVRNGSVSFSADGPPIYAPNLEPIPKNQPTGRNNNQGFEGLTTNPDRTKLYVLIQSALNQEGGLTDHHNRYARMVVYDITSTHPQQEAEYVVPLPHVIPGNKTSQIAGQSEIHYISDTQFLVLARDSDAGRGQDSTQSIYRHIDVFDISKATDVSGSSDCFACAIADVKGFPVDANITVAKYCSWLDFNVNSQLNRFGVHNGGAQDDSLLNEKWESMALVPCNPGSDDGEYYLFSISDNDFETQDGYMNFGRFRYKDSSGDSLRSQVLAFKVKLPAGAAPLMG